jgi:hypothetical protein
MRNWKVGVAAAVVAALVVALSPTANAGKGEPELKPPGPWMTCAGGKPVSSGRITDFRMLARPDDDPYLQMKVTIDPCHKPGRRDVFAAVLFSSDRSHRPIYVSRYYGDLARGEKMLLSFAAAKIPYGVGDSYIQAACLSSRETPRLKTTKRLDCIKLAWSRADQAQKRPPKIIGHISPNDPLVRRTAEYVFETDPGCADCNWG